MKKRPPGYDPIDWLLRFCWLSPEGCWLYMRSTDRCGYVQAEGTMAHRLVYEREVGPIPEGLEIDHLCRQRNCLNPAHMEPVTRQENVARGTSGEATRARWRSRDTCKRGHSDWEWVTMNDRHSGKARRCATCRRERDR